jgi:hypothetical protein
MLEAKRRSKPIAHVIATITIIFSYDDRLFKHHYKRSRQSKKEKKEESQRSKVSTLLTHKKHTFITWILQLPDEIAKKEILSAWHMHIYVGWLLLTVQG